MDKTIKKLNYLDWTVGSAVLAYGAWAQDIRFIAAGLFSFVIAYLNPAKHVKRLIEKRMLASPRRKALARDAASAVRIAQEEAAYAKEATARPATPASNQLDFGAKISGYGPVTLRQSKHNLLSASSFSLRTVSKTTRF